MTALTVAVIERLGTRGEKFAQSRAFKKLLAVQIDAVTFDVESNVAGDVALYFVHAVIAVRAEYKVYPQGLGEGAGAMVPVLLAIRRVIHMEAGVDTVVIRTANLPVAKRDDGLAVTGTSINIEDCMEIGVGEIEVGDALAPCSTVVRRGRRADYRLNESGSCRICPPPANKARANKNANFEVKCFAITIVFKKKV